MADARMKDVIFQEDFQLDISLDSGHRIIYNLGPKLETARFSELSDWNIFCSGWLVGGKRICWTTGVELTLNEILLNINYIKE